MSELIVAAQLDSVCRPICPRRDSFNIHLSFQQQLLKFFFFFFFILLFQTEDRTDKQTKNFQSSFSRL